MNRRDPTIAELTQPVVPDVGAMLDAAGRGEMAMTELTIALANHCRGDADAVWEALALADQYFRRGRINADICAAVKSELHALVFPPPQQPPNIEQRRPAQAQSRENQERGQQAAVSAVRREIPPLATPRVAPAPVNEAVNQVPRGNTSDDTAPTSAATVESLVEPPVEPRVMLSTAEIRARAELIQRVQAASASAAAKSSYKPHNFFREPNYSGEVSAKPKVLIGVGILVVVVIAVGYVLLASKPTPPSNNTVTKASQPHAGDVDASELPTPASTESAPTVGDEHVVSDAANHPVERAASVPDVANSAPVSPPIAPASPPNTEARARPVISFAVDPIVVDDSDSAARIVVHRSFSMRREWSVKWRTVEGSAKAERDFVATSDGVLSFSPGARDAVILVPIVKDSTRRHADWFEVEVVTDAPDSAPNSAQDSVQDSGQHSGDASQDSALRAMVIIQSAQATKEGEGVSPSPSSNPGSAGEASATP